MKNMKNHVEIQKKYLYRKEKYYNEINIIKITIINQNIIN